ncbi:MAG: DUF892 family protein [Verrucomicrobiaceae bacterium]|nr:DUF892 family protein [Verrucomicrobiaceae bacterium]
MKAAHSDEALMQAYQDFRTQLRELLAMKRQLQRWLPLARLHATQPHLRECLASQQDEATQHNAWLEGIFAQLGVHASSTRTLTVQNLTRESHCLLDDSACTDASLIIFVQKHKFHELLATQSLITLATHLRRKAILGLLERIRHEDLRFRDQLALMTAGAMQSA